MKCPYRMNELHTCHDGKTYNYKEFAECYGKVCPYFGVDKKGGWCRKVVGDAGFCAYQEVH